MSNVVKLPGSSGRKQSAAQEVSATELLSEVQDEQHALNTAIKKMKPLNLEAAQELTAWQAQLLQCYADADLPDQYVDREFGATITRESHDRLTRFLALHGVTDLDPSDPERYDEVLGTWWLLGGWVKMDVENKYRLKTIVHDREVHTWDPTYRQYFEALWAGDSVSVRMLARSLGIHAGVTMDQANALHRKWKRL